MAVQEAFNEYSRLAWLLVHWCPHARQSISRGNPKMKAYLYTGVHDIPPGKNIVVFCGRFQQEYYGASGGDLIKDKFTRSTIRSTYTGDSETMRVVSTRAYPKKRDIDILLADANGTTQQLQYSIRGCGKGNVFGHHHRLTVKLLEYPVGDNKGKAVSAINGMPVPFRGVQLKSNLKFMVRDWMYHLFSDVAPVFFDEDKILDIFDREEALENCDMESYIPLSWNPMHATNIPDDIKRLREDLIDSPGNNYRQMTYADCLLTYLTRDKTNLSLEEMIDLELLPCYPVFNVSPYGPRVWDEDKYVRYAGVLQKQRTKKNNTHFSNHTLCKKLERWLGRKVDIEELLKAVDRPEGRLTNATDVYSSVEIEGCELFFLGVTEQTTRKEKSECD